MTANGMSPHRKPAEASRFRPPADNVRPYPIAPPTPAISPKSTALQRPGCQRHDTREPRPPVNAIIPIRQAHQPERSIRRKTVKSP